MSSIEESPPGTGGHHRGEILAFLPRRRARRLCRPPASSTPTNARSASSKSSVSRSRRFPARGDGRIRPAVPALDGTAAQRRPGPGLYLQLVPSPSGTWRSPDPGLSRPRAVVREAHRRPSQGDWLALTRRRTPSRPAISAGLRVGAQPAHGPVKKISAGNKNGSAPNFAENEARISSSRFLCRAHEIGRRTKRKAGRAARPVRYVPRGPAGRLREAGEQDVAWKSSLSSAAPSCQYSP